MPDKYTKDETQKMLDLVSACQGVSFPQLTIYYCNTCQMPLVAEQVYFNLATPESDTFVPQCLRCKGFDIDVLQSVKR